MKHAFVTSELPQDSKIVIALQLIYSVNLVCSYAIMIHPANMILEDYLLRPISKRAEAEGTRGGVYTTLKWHTVNLIRLLVCLLATFCAIELSDVLDKFLSLLGALLCAPLAILFPALIHLKVSAKTTRDKLVDIGLVSLATLILVFCTV